MSNALTSSFVEVIPMGQNDILALEANFNNWLTERAVGSGSFSLLNKMLKG